MIFLLGSSFCLFEKAIPWKFHYAIFAIGMAVLFLFVGALAELAIGLFWGYAVLYFASYAKEFGAFNKLPDLSYGLYLYAWPVTKIIYWYWPHANLFACILATFVASIGLGAASWYGIEKPFMKMKYSKRKPAAVPQRPVAQVGP
jgi:peptidoglycan/LPS O-acetylase OafA/YrhL